MNTIEPCYVLPEDSAAGVRAFVALPSRICVHFCPADYVATLLSKILHGYVPAAYALLSRQRDGTFKVREGETTDFFARMSQHLSERRNTPFDAVIWFSGSNIDKEKARALQFLMGATLEINGCGATVPSNAGRPRDIVWDVACHSFLEIRALTRHLGCTFFEAPAGATPHVHLHLEIEAPSDAEELWDFDGGYVSTVALIAGEFKLLAHSQIRDRVVPSARKLHVALRKRMRADRLLMSGPPGTLFTLCDLPFPSLDNAAKFLRGDLAGCRRMWVPRDLPRPSH